MIVLWGLWLLLQIVQVKAVVTKFKDVGETSGDDTMMNNTKMSGMKTTSTLEHHDDLQFCNEEVTIEEVTNARSLTKTSGNSFLDSELKADTMRKDNNKKSANKASSSMSHHEDWQHSHDDLQHSHESWQHGEDAEADCDNCLKKADASVPGNRAVGIVRGAIRNNSKSQAYTSGNSFLDSELKAAK